MIFLGDVRCISGIDWCLYSFCAPGFVRAVMHSSIWIKPMSSSFDSFLKQIQQFLFCDIFLAFFLMIYVISFFRLCHVRGEAIRPVQRLALQVDQLFERLSKAMVCCAKWPIIILSVSVQKSGKFWRVF